MTDTDTPTSTLAEGRAEELRARLRRHEAGAALATIRDTRLYRATHATFEDYCRARRGIARQTAYQLISAAGVVENVRNCVQTLPVNERQVRPLAALTAEQQAVVPYRVTTARRSIAQGCAVRRTPGGVANGVVRSGGQSAYAGGTGSRP